MSSVTRPRLHVRLVAALVLLAVAGGTLLPGYCLMQRPSLAQESGADAHDCCAAGIGAAAPACCHADAALAPSAVLASQSKPIVLAATVAAWTAPASACPPVRVHASWPHSTHSPPPTVLRV